MVLSERDGSKGQKGQCRPFGELVQFGQSSTTSGPFAAFRSMSWVFSTNHPMPLVLQDVLSFSASWSTRRNGNLKTIGVALSGSDIDTADQQLAANAAAIAVSSSVTDGEKPAAFGKIILINPARAELALYQQTASSVEPVHCANAVAAGCAIYCDTLRQRAAQLQISHPITPALVTARVQVSHRGDSVATLWELSRRSILLHSLRENGVHTVRVSGVNHFCIQLVSEFPDEPPPAAKCAEKVIYILPADRESATVRVASCGRWHGALPMTALIALGIARSARTFVSDVMADGTARVGGFNGHPQVVETLPNIDILGSTIRVQLPETEVAFERNA